MWDGWYNNDRPNLPDCMAGPAVNGASVLDQRTDVSVAVSMNGVTPKGVVQMFGQTHAQKWNCDCGRIKCYMGCCTHAAQK